MRSVHIERHRTERIGWLRAAVLGANDGIVSTASLVVGVAAANAASSDILVAGVAGLVAGAMSMAAGEYVSVSSQADTEQADIERERKELATDDKHEHEELAAIYVQRGLDAALAKQVAEQLMAHDALAAHARDELGISDTIDRPARSGRVCLRRNIRGRRGDAAVDRARHSPSGADSSRGCNLHSVPRAPGRVWSLRRRRSGDEGPPAAGHVLGRAGDGAHGWSRGLVRRDRLETVPKFWPVSI